MSQPISLGRSLRGAVLTVSDTRTASTDRGGQLIQKSAEEAGLTIVERDLCQDGEEMIQTKLNEWLQRDELDFIITTGGTGIAKRDVTIEAVRPLLDKVIDGFGECFRYLSFTKDIGTRAIASRALAGVSHDKIIFTLPGSTGAVKLAMNQLILPELAHLVYEARKHLPQL